LITVVVKRDEHASPRVYQVSWNIGEKSDIPITNIIGM